MFRIKGLVKDKFELNENSKELERLIKERSFTFKSQYNFTIKHIEYELSKLDSDIKRKRCIESMINILLLDLQYSYLNKYTYTWSNRNEENVYLHLFPYRFKNKNGELIDVKDEGYAYYDLKGVYVISRYKDINKWERQISRKEEFKTQEDHKVELFKRTNIATIINGHHSITDGWLNRDICVVKCTVYDEEELFKNIYSDGFLWYNKYDGSMIEEVADFRLAVVHYLYTRSL